MAKKNVDLVQLIVAIALIASGVVMAFIGFFTEPKGEISDSVLWYFAQTLIYGGSVVGMKSYVDIKLSKNE